jgi:hypothetical protein
LIKSYSDRHAWSLSTIPKSLEIKLPGDAFKSITDGAKAKEIGKTVYLPEEILKELDVKEKKVSSHQS